MDVLKLLQQLQQAQQMQQLQQLSQQQQPAHLLLQSTTAFQHLQQQQQQQQLLQQQQQLQFLQQQRNLLFQQIPLESQASITEVPISSPSPSSLIPSSSAVVTPDITQSSCASNDTASVDSSSKTEGLIEVESVSAVKAALAAKDSSNESKVKVESKSLKPVSVDTAFTISSSSDDEEDDDTDGVFEPKKPRKTNGKQIDDPKKKSGKGPATTAPEKPKSRAGRPKNSKNKGVKKSTLIKELESLQSSSMSVINADNVPETSGRSLRSNGRSEPQTGPSSNLQSVDIGFDFTPRKSIEPEILERIEACIVQTNTSWHEVVGLDTVKQRLREAAVLPIIRPDLFVGYRAASKGVLLYGPPGTGKTMLAKCAASATNCTFISVRASDIMSKWIGDGEKGVAALFEVARRRQPTIIFIDEVDSLLSARRQGEHEAIRRLKTELLTQWDGLSGDTQSRIMVLGATNRPMDLDLAAMRRFGQHLYVPLPDLEARKGMFKKYSESEDVKVDIGDHDMVMLALHTSNYSAADIRNVLNDASMAPIRELTYDEIERVPADELRPVCRKDVENTLLHFKPTCSAEAITELENWNQRSL